MAKDSQSQICFSVRYDGLGPVHWDGGPGDFGLQDKDERLLAGAPDADGGVVFGFSLAVRAGAAAPIFTGAFAHGPPGERFLYLSWRNRAGAYAQRLKLPLGSISQNLVDQALRAGASLCCVLEDKAPRATSTGANIGGTRRVAWTVGAPEA